MATLININNNWTYKSTTKIMGQTSMFEAYEQDKFICICTYVCKLQTTEN